MNKQQKSATKRGIEWRTIPGLEGLYEASSDGQVRSLPRKTTNGKILTPQLNNSGYFRVSASWGRQSRYLYVHHLVAAAFIGPRPQGYDVNHINGVKADNRAENLEYTTRFENMKHAREHGLHDNRGEKQWMHKLTEEDARGVLRAYNQTGISAKEMAPALGVSERTVRDVLEGKTWRHIDE